MLLKLLSFTLTGAKSICKNIITTLSMHEWVATTFNMVEEECLKSFVGVVIVNVVIIIVIQLTMLNLFVKCITFQRQASDSATRTLSKINRKKLAIEIQTDINAWTIPEIYFLIIYVRVLVWRGAKHTPSFFKDFWWLL